MIETLRVFVSGFMDICARKAMHKVEIFKLEHLVVIIVPIHGKGCLPKRTPLFHCLKSDGIGRFIILFEGRVYSCFLRMCFLSRPGLPSGVMTSLSLICMTGSEGTHFLSDEDKKPLYEREFLFQGVWISGQQY